jgi:1-deoxy-D-xylulose-5-phosphate reductoisomerase
LSSNLRKIGILGSTGSIGINSLEVIKNLNRNGFNIRITFLTSNNRIDLLAKQVDELHPETVFIQNQQKANEFRKNYNFNKCKIFDNFSEFLKYLRECDTDIVINSLVGINGLIPTVELIKSGKNIALANKESLVVAGKLINELLHIHKTKLYPIDSEHSAIMQCLTGEKRETVVKIFLTASGGPFRTKTIGEMSNVTVDEALNHPNWNMGNKITIDSASMMNKGLEVIEAKWLFNLDPEQIEVLIHPQSIIHSMVEFRDGSIKAQLGLPDMKIPIQYALTYPDRIISDFPKIDFRNLKELTFEQPDFSKFKCLKLAFATLRNGGSYPIVLNAANEEAVKLFLNFKIKFTEIPEIIQNELDKHNYVNNFELEDIIKIDNFVRLNIKKLYN